MLAALFAIAMTILCASPEVVNSLAVRIILLAAFFLIALLPLYIRKQQNVVSF